MKPIENRAWTTNYRGLLHIHAAKRWEKADVYYALSHYGVRVDPSSFHCGGIIGVVELFDIVTHDPSLWFVGPFGWKLRNARALPFLPLRGYQNIFGF